MGGQHSPHSRRTTRPQGGLNVAGETGHDRPSGRCSHLAQERTIGALSPTTQIVMSEQSYLAAKYAEFETDALVEMYRSGLTAIAQEVARVELISRGVEPPSLDELTGPDAIDQGIGDWVIVARCSTPTEAHILRSCLEAAAIPVTVLDGDLVQANSLLTIAVGGVRVVVPERFTGEAREVMEAFKRGDLALGDDADLGSA